MSNLRMKDISSNEKPREKLMKLGVSNLSNVELLAIILDTGSCDKSVLDLSQEVLSLSKGLSGIRGLSIKDFMSIKGIGPAKTGRILASLELSSRIAKQESENLFQIDSAVSVANLFMEELRYQKREVFKVLFLDTKNKIICDRNISVGSLNASIVHPREVFKEAVLYSSNKIFLIHNHPSGDTEPSREDILVTERLKKAGELLGIEVLDHIIIGNGKYSSLRECGYL